MRVSDKLINLIFITLLCLSLAIVTFVFFIWNNQSKVDDVERVDGNDKINYWIDKCEIEHDGQTILVSGWGYIEGMPYIKHEVYVKSKSGGFYLLNTVRQRRKDVQNFLKLSSEYEKIGFSSSLRIVGTSDFSNEIVFTMRGPYGNKANVEYTCN